MTSLRYTGDYTARLLRRRMRTIPATVTASVRADTQLIPSGFITHREMDMVRRFREAHARNVANKTATALLGALPEEDHLSVLLDLLLQYEARTGEQLKWR